MCQASNSSAAERKTSACLLKGCSVPRICLGGRQNFKAVSNVSGLSSVGKFENIYLPAKLERDKYQAAKLSAVTRPGAIRTGYIT